MNNYGYGVYHRDSRGTTLMAVHDDYDEAVKDMKWWAKLYCTWYPGWYVDTFYSESTRINAEQELDRRNQEIDAE